MKSPVDKERIALAVRDFQRRRNRERSFRILFDQYYEVLQGFFAQRVLTPEDRLDLTQETFLRVYRGLKGYRGEADFGTWLFRIAFNTHLKWLDRQRGNELSLELGPGGEPEENERPEASLRGPRPTPLDDTLRKERQRRLHQAIDELPEQMRRCMQLRVDQDLRYREIAAVLRLSVETVKVHLYQARKKLKRALRDDFEDVFFGIDRPDRGTP